MKVDILQTTEADLEEYLSHYDAPLMEKIPGEIQQDNFREKEDVSIIKQVLNTNGIAYSDFKKFVVEYVKQKLSDLSILNYLYRKKSNNWSGLGKSYSEFSMCYSIFDLDSSYQVSDYKINAFRNFVNLSEYKWGNLDSKGYLEILKNGSFNFFGVQINHSSLGSLNKYLKVLGLENLYLYSTEYQNIPEFILGELKEIEIQGLKACIIKKELTRSPYYTFSLAGFAKEPPFVRLESLKHIFMSKWQVYMNTANKANTIAGNKLITSIAYALKNKILELNGIVTSKSLNSMKNKFLDGLTKSIIIHEYGHIEDKYYMDPVLRNIASCVNKHNTTAHILMEIIADWIPEIKSNGEKGGISGLVELGRKNEKAALSHAYFYLSDCFFIQEEEDDLMDLVTEVLSSLLLYFINEKGNLDIDKLEKERDSIFYFAVDFLEGFTKQILSIIEKSDFHVKSEVLSFDDIKNMVIKEFDNKENKSIEDYYLEYSFWDKIFIYVNEYSQHAKEEIELYIKDSDIRLSNEVLNLVSNGNPEKYNMSLRTYLFEQYKYIGILKNTYKK